MPAGDGPGVAADRLLRRHLLRASPGRATGGRWWSWSARSCCSCSPGSPGSSRSARRGAGVARRGGADRTHSGSSRRSPRPSPLTLLVNAIYFGGAIVGGGVSWRAARQRDRLAGAGEHHRRPGRPAARAGRRRRAAADRPRAARRRRPRRLRDGDPGRRGPAGARPRPRRRATALAHVEEASRDAVTQMRRLLGTLREGGEPEGGAGAAPTGSRTPGPGLTDLADLVGEVRRRGSQAVSLDVVEPQPGAAAQCPRGGRRSRSTAPSRRR